MIKIRQNHIMADGEYFHLDDVAMINIQKYGKIRPVYCMAIRLINGEVCEVGSTDTENQDKIVATFEDVKEQLIENEQTNFTLVSYVMVNMDNVKSVEAMQDNNKAYVSVKFPRFSQEFERKNMKDAEKLVEKYNEEHKHYIEAKGVQQ